jgi:hypothetical protein
MLTPSSLLYPQEESEMFEPSPLYSAIGPPTGQAIETLKASRAKPDNKHF